MSRFFLKMNATTTTTQFDVVGKLLTSCRPNTQIHILLSIFNQIGYNTVIPKRQLEKRLGLAFCFSGVQFGEGITIHNFNDLLAMATYLPGDLQRQVRTFYDKYHKYGLQRIETEKKAKALSSKQLQVLLAAKGLSTVGKKQELVQRLKDAASDGEDDEEEEQENVTYMWAPISEDEFNWINGQPKVPRNIFANDADRDAFVNKYGKKCEICGDTNRLAVDHWRAHSVYGIDSPDIAVLLCETCNNTHHNVDASKIMIRKQTDLKCVKNWINIEKRVREKGYMPNAEDQLAQNQHIQQVLHYYHTEHQIDIAELHALL